MQYEPVSVTPNGHSVGSMMAADSIGQNAAATATPASTMYKYNVQVYVLVCTSTIQVYIVVI